jgi:hypothetical protein
MRDAVLVAIALLAGCAAEPVPYHSGNEIPRGPGLLTGAQGEFVLNTSSISAAPRNEAEEREYQEWRESKRRREAGTE